MHLFRSMFSKVVSVVIWLCSLVVAQGIMAGHTVEEAAHILETRKQKREETVVSQYPPGPATCPLQPNILPPGSIPPWHGPLAGGPWGWVHLRSKSWR